LSDETNAGFKFWVPLAVTQSSNSADGRPCNMVGLVIWLHCLISTPMD